MRKMRGFAWVLSLVAASGFAQGSVLSLSDALKLARERNGTVQAAVSQLEAARAAEKQAAALFLPTITPSLTWSDQKQEFLTGVPSGFNTGGISSSTTTQIRASWELLDSGQRDLGFRAAKRGVSAQAASSLQTLRSTLFGVHTQYLDATRARELVRVQDAQVERNERVVKQVEAQIKVGEAAEKDILQPKADALNAIVNRLASLNRQSRSEADLKATIGWEQGKALPALEDGALPTEFAEPESLESLIEEGLKNRADLIAQRDQLEASKLNARSTRLNSGLTWSLSANYTKQFGPDNTNNRLLQFTASMPLFDGDRSRQAAREADLRVKASESTLTQAERVAVSEIEAAWRELSLNAERVKAAVVAREAAQVNYDRVTKSNALGALNVTVVDISTAQLTLVTAETNYVEAVYDYLISQVRIRLVVGRALPGE